MKNAYTLIELLIVIGILAVLTGLSSLSLVSYSKSADIGTSKTIVMQTLLQARGNSMADVDDKTWGVHLETNRVILFSGASYNPNDGTNQVKPISGGTSINTSLSDVIFAKRTGATANTGDITITGQSSNAVTIMINEQGNIY